MAFRPVAPLVQVVVVGFLCISGCGSDDNLASSNPVPKPSHSGRPHLESTSEQFMSDSRGMYRDATSLSFPPCRLTEPRSLDPILYAAMNEQVAHGKEPASSESTGILKIDSNSETLLANRSTWFEASAVAQRRTLAIAMHNLITKHPNARQVRICDTDGNTIAFYDARGDSAMR
jgi:hypothetical protein